MRSLVLGLGNPILTGDRIGIHIAKRLEGTLEGVDVAVRAAVDLEVLDLLSGYRRAFVIDAMSGSNRPFGEMCILDKEEPGSFPYSTHTVSFFDLLGLGVILGYRMPEAVKIFGIEIGEGVLFGEELPPELVETLEGTVESISCHIRAEIA